MLVECKVEFYDKAEKAMRKVGDRFEVTDGRFAEINRTRYGQLVEAVAEEVAAEDAVEEKPWWESRTRSELFDMAYDRGIEVPSKATKADIAALLEA